MSTITPSVSPPAPVAVPDRLITVEELLAMPEDQIERDLIRGRLRERPMTRRNRFHAATEARVAFALMDWLRRQPEPRGEVFSGEVGCILRRSPDTTVGIDVAYVSAEMMQRHGDATTLLEGAPTLVAEVLSPSDTVEAVHEKIDEYLGSGVAIVWILDAHLQTVTVHRQSAEPELFNRTMTLDAEPHLPGLSIPVSSIFESSAARGAATL